VIERFNFYDVFGFFIPGSVLLLLLWLPFGVMSRSFPPSDLSSALVGVIVAYLAGHFLQSWANRAFPLAKGGRYPSSRLLDKDEKVFSSKRSDLIRLLLRETGINVEAASTSDEHRVDADDRRDVAFPLARQQLIARKRVGYAEQFEGLYTMMRGVMVAAIVGSAYLYGLIQSRWIPTTIINPSLVFVSLLAVVAMSARFQSKGLPTPVRRESERRRSLLVMYCLFAGAALAGAGLGKMKQIGPHQQFVLLFCLFGSIALALQTAASYQYFSVEFAKAVYRGFLDLHSGTAPNAKETDDQD
jgi:hypothetical protein